MYMYALHVMKPLFDSLFTDPQHNMHMCVFYLTTCAIVGGGLLPQTRESGGNRALVQWSIVY